MNRGRYIGAVVVGIAGAIWIAYSLGEIRLAYASRDWPKTAGTVISASAEAVRREDRREHEAPEVLTPVWFRISYQYAVEGVTYNGNQVYAGQWLPISDWGARELRERYNPARKVQVFYDPARPWLSVLEPGFDSYFAAMLVTGYFAM